MPHLSIEILFHDIHLINILTTATNDRYSGSTSVYINEDGQELIDFGNRLKGFPKSLDQVEKIEFGYTQEYKEEFQELLKIAPLIEPAIAYVGLKFYSIDGSRYPAALVTLQEDGWMERLEAIGKASFELRFEPAQLDKFAEELIEMGKNKKGLATLEGIYDRKNPLL